MLNDTSTSPAPVNFDAMGVIVVDHGSRRAESNALLLDVVELFRRQTNYRIVEPAHMELAEPSVATALDRCVERGAKLVVVMPYFLLPGRHWDQDIPRLTAEAAARHHGIKFLVTAPLGLHPAMTQIMDERIRHCLQHTTAAGQPCPLCQGTDRCQIR